MPGEIDEIVTRTVERLTSERWPVVVPTDGDHEAQLAMMLREAWHTLASIPPGEPPLPEYGGVEDDLLVGADHAEAMNHPAAALIMAEVLFDTALEPFARLSAAAHGHSAVTVAAVVHHVVWRRFPAGAIGYTAALRRRLFELERDRRLSLSRELHDRVAHGIAVAMQRIELASPDTASPDAQTSLAAAEGVLRSVLDDVRGLASDLRLHVGDGTLDEALRAYVERLSALQPAIRVTSSGVPRRLAPELGEGLYLIAIEAIRNARTHAATTAPVEVDVAWESGAVRVTILDRGRGFDVESAPGSTGLGLGSMRERAALLGAKLTISSAPGRGTRVALRARAEG